jgi:hypothetical protein
METEPSRVHRLISWTSIAVGACLIVAPEKDPSILAGVLFGGLVCWPTLVRSDLARTVLVMGLIGVAMNSNAPHVLGVVYSGLAASIGASLGVGYLAFRAIKNTTGVPVATIVASFVAVVLYLILTTSCNDGTFVISGPSDPPSGPEEIVAYWKSRGVFLDPPRISKDFLADNQNWFISAFRRRFYHEIGILLGLVILLGGLIRLAPKRTSQKVVP